jgi:hypothetical protein
MTIDHIPAFKDFVPAKKESVAEVVKLKVYELRGIIFVPHYVKDCYVAPGYTAENDKLEFTDIELIMRGAVSLTMPLWSRAKFKENK